MTIVPIVNYRSLRGDLSAGLRWGDVELVETEPWLRLLLEKGLSTWQVKRLYASDLSFRIDYDSQGSDELDPSWVDGQFTKRDAAQERARLVTIALWLAKPTPLSIELAVHLEESNDPKKPRFRGLDQIGQLFPDPKDSNARFDQQDIDQSREFYAWIAALPRDGAVWSALYIAWRALSERRVSETKILLYWIALEALFGPVDGNLISHRIAERVAALLGNNDAEFDDYYNRVRDGYACRSKIVHEWKISVQPGDDIMSASSQLLRNSIKSFLQDRRLLSEMKGERREQALNSLVAGKLGGRKLRRRAK